MRYFAGLDVSLEETAICVVDETGRIMKELRAASEPDPLVATLQRTGSAAGAHRFGSLLSNGVAIRKAEACRAAGDLHRSPSGQCSDEDNAEQDGTATMPGLWHRSCGRAGTGRCMSRAGNVGFGVRSWSPAAWSSTTRRRPRPARYRAVTSVSSRRRCCGAAARGSLPAIPRQACRSYQSCVPRPAARATAVCCA